MLQANGQRVLDIMGKDASGPGIILPQDMASAIAALQGAIESEETEQQAAIARAKLQGDVPPNFDAISLRKRVGPLVEMLQRSERENASVTWGV